VNVLKTHLRMTITTLLARGASQHEIAQRTGVDRKTIRRYARAAQAGAANAPMVATGPDAMAGEMPPPRPPGEDGILAAALVPHRVMTGPATSACEPHRPWIEAQVALGRNAVSVFQDLVDQYGVTHQYNSVKRFVATLKARAPERFDVLEFLPGEDYGKTGVMVRTTTSGHGRTASCCRPCGRSVCIIATVLRATRSGPLGADSVWPSWWVCPCGRAPRVSSPSQSARRSLWISHRRARECL